MDNTQFGLFIDALESIARSLKKIEYWQEHQTDIINGGFGFVRDISLSLDGGMAVNSLEKSFENKMSELIDVIDARINVSAVQTKPSDS